MEDELLDKSFTRANAETAMKLQDRTVLLQLQTLQESVRAFNSRVEEFKLVSGT